MEWLWTNKQTERWADKKGWQVLSGKNMNMEVTYKYKLGKSHQSRFFFSLVSLVFQVEHTSLQCHDNIFNMFILLFYLEALS